MTTVMPSPDCLQQTSTVGRSFSRRQRQARYSTVVRNVVQSSFYRSSFCLVPPRWHMHARQDVDIVHCSYKVQKAQVRIRADQRSLRRLRSCKVTDFGANRKPICNFLLVHMINTIYFTSHLSPCLIYLRLLVKFALSTGLPLFITMFGVNP